MTNETYTPDPLLIATLERLRDVTRSLAVHRSAKECVTIAGAFVIEGEAILRMLGIDDVKIAEYFYQRADMLAAPEPPPPSPP